MRGAIPCLMVALVGCTMHANRQVSLPPAPNIAAVKQAPDPPLSIPQTSAALPSPQLIDPAAIPQEHPPQEPPAVEKAEAPAAPIAPKTNGPRTKQTDTTGTQVPPDTEEPAAPAPVPSEQAPFQPIMPLAQQNQLKNSILSRKREIASLLLKASDHPGNDQTLVDHIKSFLKLADEAEQRGDFTQADNLSERALILAQELKVE